MSDSRTTRLAHPDFTPAQVEAFLTYQRTLLRSMLDASGDDWAGRFAFAHAKGMAASKLDGLTQRQLSNAAAAYCGRRTTALMLEERLKKAKAAQAAGRATPKDLDVLDKAGKELQRLDDLSDLAANFGTGTFEAFAAREPELLELHRAVAQAEGKGHLHPPG